MLGTDEFRETSRRQLKSNTKQENLAFQKRKLAMSGVANSTWEKRGTHGQSQQQDITREHSRVEVMVIHRQMEL